MTAPADVPASGLAPRADGPVWHTLSTDRVLHEEKVNDNVGLSSAEAASRAQRFGPNKLGQWLICLAVSLSIVVVTEIRKAVRRSSTANTPNHPGKGDETPQSDAQHLGTGPNRAGPDGGHASQLAAQDRSMTEKV